MTRAGRKPRGPIANRPLPRDNLSLRQDRRRKIMNIRADQIWTGTLNERDTVQKGFDHSRTVRFYDTTLRDGEQSTGVCFSANDKFEIACKLAELGVGRIESGFPRVSDEDTQAVKRILAANLSSEIWGFARCLQADIDAHIEL